uniref:Basic tail secreted protein n=1 Tax=Rhipicephalus appendiculatus TaxID=34631 RepID=A0A131YS19_RHIAP
MEVILRLGGVLLIAGGGLSQSYQRRLHCQRLIPSALTSVITPCRFPCRLSHRESSYSIILEYDPDGTPCQVGRCRGGSCLGLGHYRVLESSKWSLSSASRHYDHLERAKGDSTAWNTLILTNVGYARINVFREASMHRHAGHVASSSVNRNVVNGFPNSDSKALASIHRLYRVKRAAPRLHGKKGYGKSFSKEGAPGHLEHGAQNYPGRPGYVRPSCRKNFFKRHKKKILLGVAATAVAGTAVGLKAAKMTTKPQCRHRGKSCNNSEESETERSSEKPKPKRKRLRKKVRKDHAEATSTEKQHSHKDDTTENDGKEAIATGDKSKKATEHGDKNR